MVKVTLLGLSMCPILLGKSLNASCGTCIRYAGSAAMVWAGKSTCNNQQQDNGVKYVWPPIWSAKEHGDTPQNVESGISLLALTEKGMVSQAVADVGVLAKTLSGRGVTDLQQFHSSTIPFGEAIWTCAAAAL